MADESITGVNYFDHQFLRKGDFEAARQHHEDRLRQHNRLLHSAGVVEGLAVTRVGTTSIIQVATGRALDAEHREVVLRQTSDPAVPPLLRVQTSAAEFQESQAHLTGPTLAIDVAGVPASPLPDNPVFITIRQGILADTPTTDPGLTGKTRLKERAVVEAGIVSPSGAQLLLAQVNRNPDGTIRDLRTERDQAGSVLADGTVTEAKLANNAVSASKLRSDAATDANRAVTTNHIRDLNVTEAKLANDAVTEAKLRDAANDAQDALRAVTANHIRNGAVTGLKIAPAAVTGDKIANDAVGMAKLDSDVRAAITSGGIPDGGVTEPKLANNAVSASKLRSDAATDANRAVTTNHLRNGAVVEAKLADGAVNLAKLRFRQVNAGSVTVNTNVPTTVMVEQGVANTKTTIYFPSLTLQTVSGIASSEVDAQIVYRHITGASTVDVLIRLTNHGPLPANVDWVVNTFAP